MEPNSSLLQWLATFQIDGQNSVELKDDAYYNLADGFVCARILNQISPQYFSNKWLDGIKPVPPNGSWRLRVSNLKRILQKIYDYASDLQSQQFKDPTKITPDVGVIAQNFDSDQICKLIQLILFCAINCDKKHDYIEKISTLPTQVKQHIKEAIEELLIHPNENTSHSVNGSTEFSDNNERESRITNLNTSSSSNNVYSPSRNSSLSTTTPNNKSGFFRRDSSVDISRRNEQLLNDSSNNYDIDTVENIKRKLNLALTLKDEKAQACHELELKLEQLRLEKEQLAYENEKLINEKSANNSRKLSDSRIPSQVTTSSTLVSPSSGTPHNKDFDLSFETKNSEFRYNNLIDDSTQSLILQHNKKLQSELNRLKEHIIKLDSEKEDFRLKCQYYKEDLDRITHKQDELMSKAELAKRLQDELDEHKQISEKIVTYEARIDNLVKKNNDLKRETKTLEELNISNKHKIVILEEENSRLCSTIKEIDFYKKQFQEIQVKLSQETYRAEKVEVELARLLERYTSVKKENEKLYETANQLMPKGLSNTTLRDQPIIDEPNNRVGFANPSDSNAGLIIRIEELERQLLQKEHELMESKAKYKNNLQKAREVIKALNDNKSVNTSLQQSGIFSTSSINCTSIDESNVLKQRLKVTEDSLMKTEREFYEYKKMKEIHERLIITAFYGLTTPKQWKNAEKRLERTTLTSPPNTASSSINHSTKHSH